MKVASKGEKEQVGKSEVKPGSSGDKEPELSPEARQKELELQRLK